MTKFENVPYRRWGRGKMHGKLMDCPEGKRLMTLMGKEMAAGRAVEFTQSQPMHAETGDRIPHPSGIYDTISVTIHD